MTIRTATMNAVATIEIARPDKKNALTQAMYSAMAEAIAAADADAAVRAVLIAGQPGMFCAGNDLDDFANRPPRGDDAPVFRFQRALMDCGKPVVAAVTGPAVGIGTTMLLHCDFVYVADDAYLSMPFVALGLVPEFASSLLLPRLIGRAKAAEKLLLGDPIRADETVELGLANAVLPAAEVLPHARRVAERFNRLPPGAVRAAKKLLNDPRRDEIARVNAAESVVFGERLKGPETREALSAFFERRAPDFSKF